MSATPDNLDFTLIKGFGLPPEQVVEVTSPYPDPWYYVEDAPNWLSRRVYSSEEPHTVRFGLNSYYANDLAPGTYNVTVTVFSLDGDFMNQPTETFVPFPSGTIDVTLEVIQGEETLATPTALTFEFTIGGALPAAQDLSITSARAWTLSKNDEWLVLGAESGTDDVIVPISVNVSGLTAGTYRDTITLADFLEDKDIEVTLIITDTSGDPTYLHLSDTALTFAHTRYTALPPLQQISFDASHPWAASSNVSWASIDRVSGASGTNALDISINLIADQLVNGPHEGLITFLLNNITRQVRLTLIVATNNFGGVDTTEPIDLNTTLLFTDDDNFIQLAASEADTYMLVKMSSFYDNLLHTAELNVPMINGVAKRRVGSFAKTLFDSIDLKPKTVPSLFIPFVPPTVDILVQEKKLFEDIVLQDASLENATFIKGHYVAQKMSTIPSTLYTTAKGVVAFHFIDKEIDPKITVSGAVDATYTFELTASLIFSAVVPMASLGDLKQGDTLTITAGNTTQNVVVLPDLVDHVLIWFQNQWGVWDVFECKGVIEDQLNTKKSHQTYQKDHERHEKKTIIEQQMESYTISTGWLYGPEHTAQLEALIDAERFWLQRGGEYIPVICTTKKLKLGKTHQYLNGYTLKFERAYNKREATTRFLFNSL